MKKKKETCALIIHGSLRGVRKFTPIILSESANVQKEQIRINLLVIWLKMSPINAPSILHGKCYESLAIKGVEEKCDIKTQNCGTFVSKSHPFLAALPNAIIDFNSIAEGKSPYTSKQKKVFHFWKMQMISKTQVAWLLLSNSGTAFQHGENQLHSCCVNVQRS